MMNLLGSKEASIVREETTPLGIPRSSAGDETARAIHQVGGSRAPDGRSEWRAMPGEPAMATAVLAKEWVTRHAGSGDGPSWVRAECFRAEIAEDAEFQLRARIAMPSLRRQ